MGRKSARRRTALAAALLAGLGLAAAANGLEIELSDPAIRRALALARFPASDADRARFHSRYIFRVTGPVAQGARLESVGIITEFRRTELIAEEHARINDLFGRSSLTEVRRALEPWRGKVYVVARVDLSGTAIAVPPIRISLDGVAPLAPAALQNNLYSENAVVGGVVAAPFAAASIGQTMRTVTVSTDQTVLGQARIDFRAFD